MNELLGISWGLIAPFLILQLILVVVALIDLSKQDNVNGPKWVWVLVILCINTIGPIIYFIFGRRKHG